MVPRAAACLVASALVLGSPSNARPVPDLRQARRAGSLLVFPDDRRAEFFYYLPGELALVRGRDGRPDFHLLEMRRTGMGVDGERGARHFRSVLAFRVAMVGPTAGELAAARAALGTAGRPIELRPLPIARLEAAVVYAPAGGERMGGEGDQPDPRLPPGQFEAGVRGVSSSTAYWTERVYSLRLDEHTSQLFHHAIRAGQLVLSFGYAFFATGIGPDAPLAELDGSPELVAVLQERLYADSAPRHGTHLVRSGAIRISADLARWPELAQQIDVNERMPPGYAALDVYCYDFRDRTREDLHAKQVEIQGEGVGGRRVEAVVLFTGAQPDLYMRSVRFSFAVRLDRPYRYRVMEVMTDGRTFTGAWRDGGPWAERLDVTTAAPEGWGGAAER